MSAAGAVPRWSPTLGRRLPRSSPWGPPSRRHRPVRCRVPVTRVAPLLVVWRRRPARRRPSGPGRRRRRGTTDTAAPSAQPTTSRRSAVPADGSGSAEAPAAGPEGVTPPDAPDGGGRARTPRRNPAKSAAQSPVSSPGRTSVSPRVAADPSRDRGSPEPAATESASEALTPDAAPPTRPAADAAAGDAATAARTPSRRSKSPAVKRTDSPRAAAATPGAPLHESPVISSRRCQKPRRGRPVRPSPPRRPRWRPVHRSRPGRPRPPRRRAPW